MDMLERFNSMKSPELKERMWKFVDFQIQHYYKSIDITTIAVFESALEITDTESELVEVLDKIFTASDNKYVELSSPKPIKREFHTLKDGDLSKELLKLGEEFLHVLVTEKRVDGSS